MCSVVDRNVVMRCMTVHTVQELHLLPYADDRRLTHPFAMRLYSNTQVNLQSELHFSDNIFYCSIRATCFVFVVVTHRHKK